MKKIICSLLLLLSFKSFAQQPTKNPYTDWITVYQEVSESAVKKVEIAFSLSKCDDQGFVIGYSYYKIRNDFYRANETLTFKFDFIKCDNTSDTETVTVNLAETGEQKAPEMWFRGKFLKGNPYDVKVLNYIKSTSGIETPNLAVENSDAISEQAKQLSKLIKNGDLAMNQNNLIDALKFYTDAKKIGAGQDVDQKISLAEQKLQSNISVKREQPVAINMEKQTSNLATENFELKALIKNGDLAMDQNNLISALKFYTDAKSMGAGEDVDQKIRLAEQKLQSNVSVQHQQPVAVNQEKQLVQPEIRKNETPVKPQDNHTTQSPVVVNKNVIDLQEALTNYMNAKQNWFDNREKIGENTKDTYYLNCQLNDILKQNFSKAYDGVVKCDYSVYSPELKELPTPSVGKIDSVNYYYNSENLKKGLVHIRGKRCDDVFFAGDVVSKLSKLYALSLYTSRYNSFGLKEQEDFKKQVSQNKLVSHEILKASITAFLKDKDCEFAKYGFQHLIANDTDAYFKKIAYLFLAVINNYEDKASGKHNLETPKLLKCAVEINKSNFLKVGNTYYSNSTFGLYIYPEYYDMLQMAIIEETADYYYNQKGLTNQDYTVPYQYFYDYFNSVKG